LGGVGVAALAHTCQPLVVTPGSPVSATFAALDSAADAAEFLEGWQVSVQAAGPSGAIGYSTDGGQASVGVGTFSASVHLQYTWKVTDIEALRP
jgi:hypothetical protein